VTDGPRSTPEPTLRDYGRFGLLFLNRGRAGAEQVVPASWVEQATTPQGPAVQWGRLFPGVPSRYGYQWWLIQPGPGYPYSAMGVFFQFRSFTSTLVGLALADGKIKTIDDPVTNYLPELKGGGLPERSTR
jgi:CubicO group peptidase (beta-lactamase class C family)